jgi:hypothetical protein
MKRQSLIDALHEVKAVENNEDYLPHLIIGIDTKENGEPNAGVLLSHGTPGIQLGMIEALIADLKLTKQKILKNMTVYRKCENPNCVIHNHGGKKKSTIDEMKTKYEASKDHIQSIIDKLPPEIADKVKNFQDKMNAAIERGDIEALENMRESVKNAEGFDEVLKKFDDISNKDGDFDINEFKGD